MRGGCLSLAVSPPSPPASHHRPPNNPEQQASPSAPGSCLTAKPVKPARSWRSMGASSKFFKSLISGKRSVNAGQPPSGAPGAVPAAQPAQIVSPSAPVEQKPLPEPESTVVSEKAASEKAPSERSHPSEKDSDVAVSLTLTAHFSFFILPLLCTHKFHSDHLTLQCCIPPLVKPRFS